jgi:hypothetical protein
LISQEVIETLWTDCYFQRKSQSVYAGPKTTLAFWRTRNIGPKSARVGGRVLYRESDVEAWITEQFAAEADSAERRAS